MFVSKRLNGSKFFDKPQTSLFFLKENWNKRSHNGPQHRIKRMGKYTSVRVEDVTTVMLQ